MKGFAVLLSIVIFAGMATSDLAFATGIQEQTEVTQQENAELCPTCNVRHHPLSADWVIEMLHDSTSDLHNFNSEMRPCPRCYSPSFKDGNSNPVTCSVCGEHFHFIKGAAGRNGVMPHDFNLVVNGVEVVPPRLYRIPGDAGYFPGMESAFTEE